MAKKVLIFDLDGPIIDAFDLIIDTLNRLSSEFGYKKIKEKEKSKIRNQKPEEILRGLGISRIKLPFVVKKARIEFGREIESLKPIKGIKETLLKLKESGYKLGILTSNSKENVGKFLEKNDLNLFDFIYSGASIFGKSKMIKELLKKERIKSREAIYIGDETRDIKAAQENSVISIAVNWGINSREILEKQSPDFLIDKPKDLIEIVKNL